MAEVWIEVDTSGLRLPDVSRKMLEQRLKLAGLAAGQAIQGMLVARAQDLGLRGTGEYVRGWSAEGAVSIDDKEISKLSVTVSVTNRSPIAAIIEDGAKAFHLPSRINWATSPRVKHTKDGKPFLHVPLRHSAFADDDQQVEQGLTRGTVSRMLPQEVYKAAAKLDYTTGLTAGPIYTSDESGRFRFVQADLYKITRVVDGKMRDVKRGNHRLGAEFGPKYKGLIRGGTERHTQYLTIRTIRPDSKGWNIPAKPGYHVAKQVAETVGPTIEKLLAAEMAGG